MPRKKLKRFAELRTFPNTFHEPESLKGRWHDQYFHNDRAIVLELGCGKGDYTIELARRFPHKNFIGADKKGDRIWKGAKTALQEQLDNVAFVRIFTENLPRYFAAGEINEIWITFPEPMPKRSKAKQRFTSPFFLEIYRQLLARNGVVHVKTDDPAFFQFSLDSIEKMGARLLQAHDDLYAAGQIDDLLRIQTTYEKRHLANGLTIKYLKFSFE